MTAKITMNPAPKIRCWQEGPVTRTKEHFELRYGSARDSGWNEWMPIAMIGLPEGRIVKVQFLVEPSEPKYAKAVREVKKEIQFYLIEKGEPDPWAYARYHCGTASNIYSDVQWSFFKNAT